MLRIGFLPSDFNPMILMLGDAGVFRALSGVLRYFSREPEDVRLDALGFCRQGRTRITLTGPDGPHGVRQVDTDTFLWRLDRALAGDFAEMADGLAEPARLAGSEMLACSTQEEIPVKLSRGEYTEDFLT